MCFFLICVHLCASVVQFHLTVYGERKIKPVSHSTTPTGDQSPGELGGAGYGDPASTPVFLLADAPGWDGARVSHGQHRFGDSQITEAGCRG
jgi:hypothetical protein